MCGQKLLGSELLKFCVGACFFFFFLLVCLMSPAHITCMYIPGLLYLMSLKKFFLRSCNGLGTFVRIL